MFTRTPFYALVMLALANLFTACGADTVSPLPRTTAYAGERLHLLDLSVTTDIFFATVEEVAFTIAISYDVGEEGPRSWTNTYADMRGIFQDCSLEFMSTYGFDGWPDGDKDHASIQDEDGRAVLRFNHHVWKASGKEPSTLWLFCGTHPDVRVPIVVAASFLPPRQDNTYVHVEDTDGGEASWIYLFPSVPVQISVEPAETEQELFRLVLHNPENGHEVTVHEVQLDLSGQVRAWDARRLVLEAITSSSFEGSLLRASWTTQDAYQTNARFQLYYERIPPGGTVIYAVRMKERYVSEPIPGLTTDINPSAFCYWDRVEGGHRCTDRVIKGRTVRP